MKVAVVGVTGLVGRTMLGVLAASSIHVTELIPVASARSVGKLVQYGDQKWTIISMQDAIAKQPDIALFSAGGSVSLEFAPQFAAVGTTVIDNSSAWRMAADVKLIVPEVNGNLLDGSEGIIANPNCSTIQMVVALKPLHDTFGVDRLVVSTYQSPTGTGQDAIKQYNEERAGQAASAPVYPHPIHGNCIPHCDVFVEHGYTKEEMKLVNETRKILGDQSLRITATAVRVPSLGGHSESVNVTFKKSFELKQVRALLEAAEGVTVLDDPAQNLYPTPLAAHQQDDVFVGRIRRDLSEENALHLWIVSDNLRKGAATNAVQIAELICAKRAALA